MSVWMIGRVESALTQSRRLFSLASKSRGARVGGGLILVGGVLASRAVAHCEPVEETHMHSLSSGRSRMTRSLNGLGGGPGGNNDPIKAFLSQHSGFLQNLGLSGVMGVCAGVALKRATREVAATIGVAFAGLQVLSYLGYITIDYSRVKKDATKLADVNGDGKLDAQDLYSLWDKVKDVLGYHLPQAGSFSSGLALGFYYF